MEKKTKHKQYYLNEFHRKTSEAAQKEVKNVSKQQFTLEEMIAQSKELNRERNGRKNRFQRKK